METFITTLAALCKLNLDAAKEVIRQIHLVLTAGGVGEVKRSADKERASDKLVRRMEYFAVMPDEEREDLFEEVLGMLLRALIEAKKLAPTGSARADHHDGPQFSWDRATKAFGFLLRCVERDFDDIERADARELFDHALSRLGNPATLGNEELAWELQRMQEGFEDDGKVEEACKVSSAFCQVLNRTGMTDATKRAQKRLARAETERTQRTQRAATGKASNAELLARLAELNADKPAEPPARSKDRGSSRGTSVPLVDNDAAAQLEALKERLAATERALEEERKRKAAEPAAEPAAPAVEEEEPAAPPVQLTDEDGNWVDADGRPVRMEAKGESGKDFGKRLKAWQRKAAKA